MSGTILSLLPAASVGLLAGLFMAVPLLRRGARGMAAVVLAGMVAGTVALYAHLGAPGRADEPILARQAEALGMDADQTAFMLDRVNALAARLVNDPEDARGWAMLGRAHQQLNRPGQAVRAYREAIAHEAALAPEEALSVRLSLTRLLVMFSGGVVGVEALDNLKVILTRAPDQPQALLLASLALAQNGDFAPALAAAEYAMTVIGDTPARAAFAAHIEALKAQLAKEHGFDPQAPAHPLPALERMGNGFGSGD